MTYRSRGRSTAEVVLVSLRMYSIDRFRIENIGSHNRFLSTKAVCFVVFLVGFITVLCIGNYFRAKRAQERQRQRRLSKLAGANGNASVAPGSVATGMYTNDGGMSYEAPSHVMPGGVQA